MIQVSQCAQMESILSTIKGIKFSKFYGVILDAPKFYAVTTHRNHNVIVTIRRESPFFFLIFTI